MPPKSTPSNFLIVDDTDPRLNYTGKWEQTSGSAIQDDGSTLNDLTYTWLGKIWNDTVHETKSNGSMVTFSFNGTAYAVFGSFLFTGLKAPRGRIDCLLDGNPVPDDFTDMAEDSGSLLGNNILICGNPSLNGTGEHELTVKIKNLTHSNFFLDYILYAEPAVDGGLDENGDETSPDQNGNSSEVMMIGSPFGSLLDDASEHHLTFSSGWSFDDEIGSVFTRTPGTFVSLAFNGTGVQLYGDLGEKSNLSNIAMYQLDDQDLKPFSLLPPNDGSDMFFLQQLLNASGLSPVDEHTLVVTHNGTKTGMALSLDFFIVEQASTSSFITTPPSSTPSSESSGSRPSTGAIVGGTIGGVILLILLTSVAVLYIRRRRRQEQSTEWTQNKSFN
ncbi:hypothetical protein D9758_013565 [Tetrapyrgos nigripes]|uniref:Uncharacterized protein n=1 Tax=Tetrapyrgos nigripes TaxID=182062 RepID=A0A8H5FKS7_9AGAR|nr:hypothetical protein D9758_013565 [Tetrapyrgos nigripes]